MDTGDYYITARIGLSVIGDSVAQTHPLNEGGFSEWNEVVTTG